MLRLYCKTAIPPTPAQVRAGSDLDYLSNLSQDLSSALLPPFTSYHFPFSLPSSPLPHPPSPQLTFLLSPSPPLPLVITREGHATKQRQQFQVSTDFGEREFTSREQTCLLAVKSMYCVLRKELTDTTEKRIRKSERKE